MSHHDAPVLGGKLLQFDDLVPLLKGDMPADPTEGSAVILALARVFTPNEEGPSRFQSAISGPGATGGSSDQTARQDLISR